MRLIEKIILICLIILIPGSGICNGRVNTLHRGQPQWVFLDGNNIRSYIMDNGILDQNPTQSNHPGFEWIIGTGKFAIFSMGLTAAAYVNGKLRMVANSYQGEMCAGYTLGGNPNTNSTFKIYKINDWDNCQINPDYANWGLMVQYGAPYVDINHNGQYDDCIDKPGIFNARQTVFVAMTDGFDSTHNPSEGFGGGTTPLNADFRLTAWCYNDMGLKDAQFLKWEIINQDPEKWDSLFLGIISDVDLGDATDDYVGCDTTTFMGYCYNFDNNDGFGGTVTYGANPPAVGIQYLKTPSIGQQDLGLSSFSYFINTGSGGPLCETDPVNEFDAYNYLKGFKRDGSPFLNPEFNPPLPTKFCYTGDPESGNGWTEYLGKVNNCGGDTGQIVQLPGGDRRIIMNSGSNLLTLSPGDTQTVTIVQHIARGTSNLNSVSLLKENAGTLKYLYDNDFNFSTSGIVRYSDNNEPVEGGYIKAVKIDGNTGRVLTLDSSTINPDGTYILNAVPPVEVDIMAYPSSKVKDFIPSYYPGTVRWEDAFSITPDSNLSNINISVTRTEPLLLSSNNNSTISGIVISDSSLQDLNDAVIYLRNGIQYFNYNVSNNSGFFEISNVPIGMYELFINRLGFTSDSIGINISNPNTVYFQNFSLGQNYVNISTNNAIIPSEYNLFQNYPNPFNPTTKIKFDLPEADVVKLAVYDITGREIKLLVNGRMNKGSHTFTFSGERLPSGIYFYSLITEKQILTRKMVLLK